VRFLTAFLVSLCLAASSAGAAPVSFDLFWTSNLDDGRTANGSIIFDDSVFSGAGNFESGFGTLTGFGGFSLEIRSNVGSLEASFDQDDFSNVFLLTTGPLSGPNFAEDADLFDFNFLPADFADLTVPSGLSDSQFFIPLDSFVNGEVFTLQSMEATAVVPLPAALPLLAAAVGVLGLMSRRRKTQI